MSFRNPILLLWASLPALLSDFYQFWADMCRIYRRAANAYTTLTPAPLPPVVKSTHRKPSRKHPSLDRPLGIHLDASVLHQFFQNMHYDTSQSPYTRNAELEAAAMRVFEAENLAPEFLQPVLSMIPMLSAGTDMPYRIHQFDVKVYITVYSTLLLYIDDQTQRFPDIMIPELSNFVISLGKERVTFKNPNIDHFFRHISDETPKHFGPICTTAIIKTSLDFLLACLIEAEFPKGLTDVPVSSGRFPSFMRLKSGSSEAYACFLFPKSVFPEKNYLEIYLPAIPDVTELIDMINDILSFYKESVVGKEENTFFMNSARLHDCDPVEVLKEVCKKQKKAFDEISKTLKRSPECLESFEVFVKGYIMWHCCQSRYRLSELGIRLGPD